MNERVNPDDLQTARPLGGASLRASPRAPQPGPAPQNAAPSSTFTAEELVAEVKSRYLDEMVRRGQFDAQKLEEDFRNFLKTLIELHNPNAVFHKKTSLTGNAPHDIVDLVYALRANGGFREEGQYQAHNSKGVLDITDKTIRFFGYAAPNSTPENPVYEQMAFKDALAMMMQASVNASMLPPNKIMIDDATNDQKRMLQAAAQYVNTMLPPDKQLVIGNPIKASLKFWKSNDYDAQFDAFMVASNSVKFTPQPDPAPVTDSTMELQSADAQPAPPPAAASPAPQPAAQPATPTPATPPEPAPVESAEPAIIFEDDTEEPAQTPAAAPVASAPVEQLKPVETAPPVPAAEVKTPVAGQASPAPSTAETAQEQTVQAPIDHDEKKLESFRQFLQEKIVEDGTFDQYDPVDHTLEANPRPIYHVVFNPDTNADVVVNDDGTITLPSITMEGQTYYTSDVVGQKYEDHPLFEERIGQMAMFDAIGDINNTESKHESTPAYKKYPENTTGEYFKQAQPIVLTKDELARGLSDFTKNAYGEWADMIKASSSQNIEDINTRPGFEIAREYSEYETTLRNQFDYALKVEKPSELKWASKTAVEKGRKALQSAPAPKLDI